MAIEQITQKTDVNGAYFELDYKKHLKNNDVNSFLNYIKANEEAVRGVINNNGGRLPLAIGFSGQDGSGAGADDFSGTFTANITDTNGDNFLSQWAGGFSITPSQLGNALVVIVPSLIEILKTNDNGMKDLTFDLSRTVIPSCATNLNACFWNVPVSIPPSIESGEANTTIKSMRGTFYNCPLVSPLPSFPSGCTDVSYCYAHTFLQTATPLGEGVEKARGCYWDTLLTTPPIVNATKCDLTGFVGKDNDYIDDMQTKIQDEGITLMTSGIALPRTFEGSLAYCYYNQQSILTIPCVPEGVTNLCSAFENCTSLQTINDWEVDIEKKVATSDGGEETLTLANCFLWCGSLSAINCKDKITTPPDADWRLYAIKIDNATGTYKVKVYDKDGGDAFSSKVVSDGFAIAGGDFISSGKVIVKGEADELVLGRLCFNGEGRLTKENGGMVDEALIKRVVSMRLPFGSGVLKGEGKYLIVNAEDRERVISNCFVRSVDYEGYVDKNEREKEGLGGRISEANEKIARNEANIQTNTDTLDGMKESIDTKRLFAESLYSDGLGIVERDKYGQIEQTLSGPLIKTSVGSDIFTQGNIECHKGLLVDGQGVRYGSHNMVEDEAHFYEPTTFHKPVTIGLPYDRDGITIRREQVDAVSDYNKTLLKIKEVNSVGYPTVSNTIHLQIEVPDGVEVDIKSKKGFMPIGAVYVQFPSFKAPSEIFIGEWQDYSSSFQGAFFRASDSRWGHGLAFSDTIIIQSSQLPNIKGTAGVMIRNDKTDEQSGTGVFTATTKEPKQNAGDGNSGDTRSHRGTINFDAHDYDHTYTDGGEVRPENVSVRIWVRVG